MWAKGDKSNTGRRGKHGLYLSLPKGLKTDGRTRIGKAILQLRRSLIADLGGDVSTQETLLLDRVIFKVLRLCSFEVYLLKSNDDGTPKQSREYLAMSNSLRLDLQALGLERRMQDVTPLKDRLAALAGEEEEGQSEDK